MEVSRNLGDDKDALQREELSAISGPTEFAEWYNRLKQIKEFHQKHFLYINLNASEKLDYITYLSFFVQLFDIAKERMQSIRDTWKHCWYASGITSSEAPLGSVGALGEDSDWFWEEGDNGSFPNWSKETSSGLTHARVHLDLSAFSY